MTHVKQKLKRRHLSITVRELPSQRVLIQHKGKRKQQECHTNKPAINPTSNRRIQHGKHHKESTAADAETAHFAATQEEDQKKEF